MAAISPGESEHSHTCLLQDDWQLICTPPGKCSHPDQLNAIAGNWRHAIVPGTVAASVHSDINEVGNYDADDWWYRLRFALPVKNTLARYQLYFEGLATLAQVWLNGTAILSSKNMFVSHRVDISALVTNDNELVLSFGSLNAAVRERRTRPRWKTRLVDQQNLRWFRTTLLGRIPGWTPAIMPVGPWRPISLLRMEKIELVSMSLKTRAECTVGLVEIDAAVSLLGDHSLGGARLSLDDHVHQLEISGEQQIAIRGKFTVPEIPLWWPHTHGVPSLVPWALQVQVNGEWIELDRGIVGFKEISLDQCDGRVQFKVNGVPVFCRGACWTTIDFLTLGGKPAELHRALKTACDAGVNMLRVVGTMVYESNDFYRLCDEFGILVWQDFMFANMDYPVADEQFRNEIEIEVVQQLNRLQRHVCISAYCGGSEIAQQAAMLGLPAGEWTNEFFSECLPRLCSEWHATIPYFPSTPWGGALPFHVSTGISHYYGVGAYRRPLLDARVARVKFTSECLGFSNVPDPETVALILDGTTAPPHHPRWKARIPRDSGSGWDFEDIRDYYFQLLFGIDPIFLRSHDVERYYALSCVVTGEVMQRIFSEWRRPSSGCGGALVWFYRDLWPGAGWGITDSTGRPKAALWYLKRAWAPQAIRITDEGLDGLDIHLVNEAPDPLEAIIELDMLHFGRVVMSANPASMHVPPRGAITVGGDSLLGYFSDSTWAYRFGPSKFDVIAVRLRERETKQLLSEDYFFPTGLNLPVQQDAKVKSHVVWDADGMVAVTLLTEVFLQSMSISCSDFSPDDNYFHLVPNLEKCILFTPDNPAVARFKAHFDALNLAQTISVRSERNREPDPISTAP